MTGRRFARIAALAAALTGAAAAAGAPDSGGAPRPNPARAAALAGEPIDVGVVLDGPWSGNDVTLEMFEGEIRRLAEGEFEVRFPASARRVADWSLAGVEAASQALLDDPEIELIVALGVLSSHAFCCREALPKPVIAPIVVEADLQGFPPQEPAAGSGIPNLNYLAFPDKLAQDLAVLRGVARFEHLAILTSEALWEAIPALRGQSAGVARELGIAIDVVPVGDSARAALAAIPTGADAAYVYPLLHLSDAEFDRLVEGLIERRLPSFSVLGRSEVERGLLAGLGRDDYLPRLARRVALNLQRILLGEPPEAIPTGFTDRDRLVINMATARALGVSPRWQVLLEAEQLHAGEALGAEPIELATAVREAIAANLDLRVGERRVAAGEQEVAAARAALRPLLEVSAVGLQIDDDRAAASLGAQPERSLTAGATLGQLLYSDPVHANVEIERRLQEARVQEQERLRLDVALEAAVAYLDLLRAGTVERIRRNNLELTRSNLDRAELRRSVGAGNPAEVYRWQSQIASDRQALVEADAGRRRAEIALARLLHRDLEERFAPAEVSREDPSLITGEERFGGYVATPRHYRVFRDFSVEEGLAAAPELRALRAVIEAQRRALTAARRSFWAPTVAARASLEELLDAGGAGSGGAFSTLPGLSFEPADDTSWSVAVSATLPLYAGGERRAEAVRAAEELAALETDFEATRERLEQRIRSALEAAGSSYAGIDLARQAAAAAGRNLELTSDAYARGAVSILELLDAQNAALNAELLAANAEYDFLIDLMAVQRATNQIDFFITPEARAAWFERLDRHFAAAGVEPWPEPPSPAEVP